MWSSVSAIESDYCFEDNVDNEMDKVTATQRNNGYRYNGTSTREIGFLSYFADPCMRNENLWVSRIQ